MLTDSALSALIGQIYTASLSRNWDDVLGQIIQLTTSNKAFFFIEKLNEPKPALLALKTTFDYDPHVLTAYQHEPLQDPFYQAMKDLQQGETVYCNQQIAIEDFIHTEYYQNYFKPMRTYHAIGGVLLRDGEYESAFAITRDDMAQPYRANELELMTLLCPHLSQAMQIFNTLQLQKDYQTLSQSVIEQKAQPVFVCSADGDILLLNTAAETVLSQRQLFTASKGKLTLAEPSAAERFNSYVHHCALFAAHDIYCKEAIQLERADGSTTIISVSPLQGCQDFTRLPAHICLVSVSQSNNLDWTSIKQQFGISAAESKLLQALYLKRKLSDLSPEFNVSCNTLRSQLQSIFSKIGVNSQTELMLKLRTMQQ
ncbi:MAG: hypothetical protein KKE30_19050 [Gammaproteobacteria bacterium]|nr:hypothetical protein [Gammaproteobacteria bacterium]MBU1556309.1 hypothetical protein [Gammaproteobacteria bacterium]MBU2071713.1 hypothetical protein [Gammaproteobacteria bacterium]MBU2182382.1 hypothetical protein [Gammaproteobacteria bacterium]MBU2203561.1 hypothetical protein [Gammaproteobacteria bacterium]